MRMISGLSVYETWIRLNMTSDLAAPNQYIRSAAVTIPTKNKKRFEYVCFITINFPDRIETIYCQNCDFLMIVKNHFTQAIKHNKKKKTNDSKKRPSQTIFETKTKTSNNFFCKSNKKKHKFKQGNKKVRFR